MKRAARVLAAVAVVLLAAAPARAQVTPPEEATPVFELVAPIASPVCGNAVLVVAVAPGLAASQLGTPLPIDPAPVFGPAFVVCGSIPQPPARLTCSTDDTVTATFQSVVAAIIGAPLPTDTRVFGAAAEQTIVIEDNFPEPLATQGIGDRVVDTLTCRVDAPDASPSPDEEKTPEPQPSSVDDEYYDEFLPDLVLGAHGDYTTALPTGEAPQRFAAQPVAGATGGPGFAYPVVFALPLAMLVIGGYFGRSLTQPVERPHR